ncbi:hypothetical protein N0V90_011378 [Kalmusia sp. IMI 367209]|nr:hypothetical protein N0V90_011378 [Kalmusia sp. IMI 367209]
MTTPSDAARQRRIAPTHPYAQNTPNTQLDDRPHSPFPSLTSRWRLARSNAHFAQRTAMRLLELCLAALALVVVPSTIQFFVRSLDTLYEVVGRRARSTFDELAWSSLVVGGGALVAWHAVLVALSYKAIIEKSVERKKGYTWGKILGRVLVPAYLVVALVGLFSTLASRIATPIVLPRAADSAASTPSEAR